MYISYLIIQIYFENTMIHVVYAYILIDYLYCIQIA